MALMLQSKRFQGLFRPIPATRQKVGLNVAIAAATGATA